MAKTTVKLADVADALKLSSATVSYVLSGQARVKKVSPKTEKMVWEKARQMGFRPNHWARSLAQKRTRTIGVIFQDLTGSFANNLTKGINEVLYASNYSSILGVTFFSEEAEKKELETMLERQVEGIIALPAPGDGEVYKTVLDAGLNVVFVCDYIPQLAASSVILDAHHTMKRIVGHLYDLNYRKIQLLSVSCKSQMLLEREQSFREEMLARGLSDWLNVAYTVIGQEKSVGYQVKQLLNQDEPPEAIVCISDSLALQVLTELQNLGVKVPQDIAVTGVGNIAMTDHPLFSLTTVDEEQVEIGRRAAKILCDQLEATSSNSITLVHERVKGKLLIRNSTADCSKK